MKDLLAGQIGRSSKNTCADKQKLAVQLYEAKKNNGRKNT